MKHTTRKFARRSFIYSVLPERPFSLCEICFNKTIYLLFDSVFLVDYLSEWYNSIPYFSILWRSKTFKAIIMLGSG